MSGYGSNPIFFNKKIKIGRPEHLLPHFPHPSTANSITFLPYPQPTLPPPPSTWTSYVYHPLYKRIRVSENRILIFYAVASFIFKIIYTSFCKKLVYKKVALRWLKIKKLEDNANNFEVAEQTRYIRILVRKQTTYKI